MADTSEKNKAVRPPVIAVMGHVDHGKTTLLDYIRKSSVATREAGGITQAISAYEIEHSGKRITFIDTPGHEAFSRMRTRGAAAADLAILVVAAEEGVKPQTQEALKILNESKTPFVVAITKIDKPGANVEKVKTELMTAGILLEGYGGQVSYQPISAKTGEGVSDLLDLLLLAAEVENLSYDPSHPASGFVLEARVSQKRGNEVVVIITDGTLKFGETLSTATTKGKVKMLEDFTGKAQKALIPSSPALIVGFEKLPEVGQEFMAGEELFDEATHLPGPRAAVAIAPAAYFGEKEDVDMRLVLKAADSGSLEALAQTISGMPFEKPITIVSQSVGDITDNDVQMAISSRAIIVGFKNKPSKAAEQLAMARHVRIITSAIIYELLTALEKLAKEKEHELTVDLEVLAVFNQEKMDRQLVGGKLLLGNLRLKNAFEVRRDGSMVASGRITTLRDKKSDITEATEGMEIGLVVNAGTMIAVGDHIVIKA